MKFSLPIDLSNLDPDEDFVRFVAQSFDRLVGIFNGQIGLVDNCKTALVTVTFANANTQQAISHSLNRIPTGYLTVGNASTGIVFDGTSAATAGFLYLQCSVAETKKLLIF